MVKFILFKGTVVELCLGEDGLWRDCNSTVYALPDPSKSRDKEVRCGVGIFSLPKEDPLTEMCAVHDYMYDSPAYQLYHTREEADKALENYIRQAKGWRRYLATPFRVLCNIFGRCFWENKQTR